MDTYALTQPHRIQDGVGGTLTVMWGGDIPLVNQILGLCVTERAR